MGMFSKATRKKLKARIALDGPSGAGKSFTAFRFAHALAGPEGRIAVIDTEYKSASKYLYEEVPEDGIKFDFDVCELISFSPSNYTALIKDAGECKYDVLVIDSLSHAWDGKGGALDTVDRKSSGKGGSFSAWKDVTPMHREMVDAILGSPCHVIVTMRSKMAYEMEEVEEKGRKKMRVQKIGLKPIQREGMEYEFDLVGDMDPEHILTISKSRCRKMDRAKATEPGAAFLMPFINWLGVGVEPPPSLETATSVKPDKNTAAMEEPEHKTEKKSRKSVRLDGGPNPEYSSDDSAPCGNSMANEIKELAEKLGVPPAIIKTKVSECGVHRLAEMPHGRAEELREKLRRKLSQNDAPF